MRKYKKGKPIKSMNELMNQEFVYFNHKITHEGWFKSWSLRFAQDMIDRGALYKAVKIEKEGI